MTFEFEGDARKALLVARDASVELGHGVIGTEHLLLGVVDGGVWAELLSARGATRERLLEAVAAVRPPFGMGAAGPLAQLPFTWRAKAALEASLKRRQSRGAAAMSVRDLAAGLIEVRGASAVRVLKECGLKPSELARGVEEEGGAAPKAT